MTREDDLRVRLGRIRNRSNATAKPFVASVLASAERVGGIGSGHRGNARSSFGRGRAAAFAASRMLNRRLRVSKPDNLDWPN
jgi:hypothetical protein